MQSKKARAGNCKMKPTCTVKRAMSHDLVENKKTFSAKWVSGDFRLSKMVSVFTWRHKIK